VSGIDDSEIGLTKGEPFKNEYVFVMEFTEDGKEVTKVVEMMDSVRVKEVGPVLAKVRAKLEERQNGTAA
jgi:hypothetical protein